MARTFFFVDVELLTMHKRYMDVPQIEGGDIVTKRISVPTPVDACERETVIQYDNASDVAIVYTWDSRYNTYLTKLGVKPVETYTNNNRPVAWLFHVPKRWVVVRRPKRMPKREGQTVPRRKTEVTE